VTAIALGVALAAPAAMGAARITLSETTIVPGASIGGVALGDTVAQAKAAWGGNGPATAISTSPGADTERGTASPCSGGRKLSRLLRRP
jgi:hypothetical protein